LSLSNEQMFPACNRPCYFRDKWGDSLRTTNASQTCTVLLLSQGTQPALSMAKLSPMPSLIRSRKKKWDPKTPRKAGRQFQMNLADRSKVNLPEAPGRLCEKRTWQRRIMMWLWNVNDNISLKVCQMSPLSRAWRQAFWSSRCCSALASGRASSGSLWSHPHLTIWFREAS
jgi:hypothetical protein